MQAIKTNQGYSRTVKELCGYKIIAIQEEGDPRHVARFQCSTCPKVMDIALSASGHTPPEHVIKRATRNKWGYRGKFTRWHCDKCMEQMAAARKQINTMLPPSSPPASATPAAAAPGKQHKSDIEPTGKQWREVLAALEVCFNAKTNRYNDSYTDESVASEIGEPVDIVEYIREDSYGALAPDPKIVVVEAALAALEEQVASLSETVAQQAKELALLRHQTQKANPAAIADLHMMIEAFDLAAMKTDLRTLQAQIGKTDVRTLDRLTKSLNQAVGLIRIEAVRDDVAALLAHTKGRPLVEIEADIDAMRKQIREGGLPPEIGEELAENAQILTSPARRGVSFLPVAARSHR